MLSLINLGKIRTWDHSYILILMGHAIQYNKEWLLTFFAITVPHNQKVRWLLVECYDCKAVSIIGSFAYTISLRLTVLEHQLKLTLTWTILILLFQTCVQPLIYLSTSTCLISARSWIVLTAWHSEEECRNQEEDHKRIEELETVVKNLKANHSKNQEENQIRFGELETAVKNLKANYDEVCEVYSNWYSNCK